MRNQMLTQPWGSSGEVAAAAAKTNTFLGQRYRRLVKRIGKLKPSSPS